MKIGSRVTITENGQSWPTGTLLYIREPDTIRPGVSKKRTHFVKFDEKSGMDYYGMWFDPNDLIVTGS